MKIIGHRGAAGLALENTRSSFRAAKAHGVDMIEFDVRLTADGHLVVIHDAVTDRLATDRRQVRRHALAELQKLKLHGGERLLSLDEALDVIADTPVIIELKDTGSVDELLLVLERHPQTAYSVCSFHHEELRRLRRVLPDVPIYASEHFAPVAIIDRARNLHATGICLNKWLVNPITYYLARHYHLEIYLYTVNSPWLARLLSRLYPGIHILTDHPERFATGPAAGR